MAGCGWQLHAPLQADGCWCWSPNKRRKRTRLVDARGVGGTISSVGHTVIQVPVIELEPVVRAGMFARECAPEVLPGTVCSHVTLLGPFVDERDVDGCLLSELRGFFREVAPFSAELGELRRFPAGITYVSLVQEQPFRDLTRQLALRYPTWPPYGGMFDDVVPHLALPLADTDLARRASSMLPVTVEVTAAELVCWSDVRVETLSRFPFGGARRKAP